MAEKTRYVFEQNKKVVISGKSFEDTQTIIEGNNYSGKLYQVINFKDLRVGDHIIKGSRKKSIIAHYRLGEIVKYA